MSQHFQRTIENFTCGHCGQLVVGNGYTNHCPSCLWSKHVDVHPGDRAALCRGMMEPYGLEVHGGESVIVHRCIVCSQKQKTKVVPADNREILVALAAS